MKIIYHLMWVTNYLLWNFFQESFNSCDHCWVTSSICIHHIT